MPFKVNNLLYIPRLISYCLYEKQLILLSVSHLRKVSIIFTFFLHSLAHGQVFKACTDLSRCSSKQKPSAVNRISNILLRIHILGVCACSGKR